MSGHSEGDTLVTETVGSATSTFTYDLLGNLRSYYNGGTSKGATYTIDGANRRIGRSENVNGTITPLQQFLYRDGQHIVAELNGNSGLLSAFSYGWRQNVPDLMLRSAGTSLVPHSVYRIITDQLGSVRLVVNLSNASVVQRIDYDEFGVPTVVYEGLGEETAFPNVLVQPFGFAGGVYDGTTGLVRFGARDYDAGVGRWTAKDPVRFRGGTNFYAYAANDPTNHTDRSGRDPDDANDEGPCEGGADCWVPPPTPDPGSGGMCVSPNWGGNPPPGGGGGGGGRGDGGDDGLRGCIKDCIWDLTGSDSAVQGNLLVCMACLITCHALYPDDQDPIGR